MFATITRNDLINIMSNQLLRKKLYDINRSRLFSLMCNEYTDVSNKQQVSMCVRWIDDSLNPHEDLLSFYELPNIASDTIASSMKNSFTRFNLPLSNLRGQTYDGASNMLEQRSVTVRAKAFNKVLTNFGPLFKLWDICLGDKLDKETRSRILGCKSQMTEFRFFFGINLAYKMYSITDNLSKALRREIISSMEGQETAMKSVETFKSMRNIDSADCFFKTVQKKAVNRNFICEPKLPRNRKPPGYKSFRSHHQFNSE